MAHFSEEEWESLCDGCGRCCLNKVEYIDVQEIHFTNISCSELDCSTGLCRSYANRQKKVPDCLKITPQNIKSMTCLPPSCGYKLVAAQKDLPDWHPLQCGLSSGPEKAQMSVKGKIISEEDITGELDDFLIKWVPPLDAETGNVLQTSTTSFKKSKEDFKDEL